MWAPDAYEGAPTPATSFMAVSVKTAAFAMMLRVLIGGFGDPASSSWASGWPPVIATLAVVTMTVANFVAGRQESVKRMLAYSSIAHAGYILVGVAATVRSSADAQGSVLFYLFAYTFSTAGAFGALILCGSRGKEAVSYEDLAGIGKRHPAAAAAFTLFCHRGDHADPEPASRRDPDAPERVLAAYYLRVLVYMWLQPAVGARGRGADEERLPPRRSCSLRCSCSGRPDARVVAADGARGIVVTRMDGWVCGFHPTTAKAAHPVALPSVRDGPPAQNEPASAPARRSVSRPARACRGRRAQPHGERRPAAARCRRRRAPPPGRRDPRPWVGIPRSVEEVEKVRTRGEQPYAA
jgi:hypothetical protein